MPGHSRPEKTALSYQGSLGGVYALGPRAFVEGLGFRGVQAWALAEAFGFKEKDFPGLTPKP